MVFHSAPLKRPRETPDSQEDRRRTVMSEKGRKYCPLECLSFQMQFLVLKPSAAPISRKLTKSLLQTRSAEPPGPAQGVLYEAPLCSVHGKGAPFTLAAVLARESRRLGKLTLPFCRRKHSQCRATLQVLERASSLGGSPYSQEILSQSISKVS